MKGIDKDMQYTLILALASTGMAILLAIVGDEAAEVSNTSGTLLGVGFRATGALAGFFIIFLLLRSTLERFSAARPMNIKLKVEGKRRVFKQGDRYQAICRIKRAESDEIIPLPEMTPRWDARNRLLLDPIRGVLPDDSIAATIRDEDGRTWEVEEFVLREPLKEAVVVEREAEARRLGTGAGTAAGSAPEPQKRVVRRRTAPRPSMAGSQAAGLAIPKKLPARGTGGRTG